MKIRSGFVSNSSSSSFVVSKHYVSDYQLEQIQNHIEEAERLGMKFYTDPWSIEVDEKGGTISGSTNMDNFDMYDFLFKIGVPLDKVEFGD